MLVISFIKAGFLPGSKKIIHFQHNFSPYTLRICDGLRVQFVSYIRDDIFSLHILSPPTRFLSDMAAGAELGLGLLGQWSEAQLKIASCFSCAQNYAQGCAPVLAGLARGVASGWLHLSMTAKGIFNSATSAVSKVAT